MKAPISRNLIALAAIVVAITAWCGCRIFSGKVAPSQSWIALSRTGAEPAGYGVYTYVLFARAAHPDVHKDDVVQRERALLTAIESLGPNPPGWFPTNLFCFPVKATPAGLKAGVENYNAQLSNSYRSMLSGRLRGGHADKLAVIRLFDDQGPFLISSPSPLHNGAASGPLLVVDFSTQAPKSIKDAIQAYRQNAIPIAGAKDQHAVPLGFLVKVGNQLKSMHTFAHLLGTS